MDKKHLHQLVHDRGSTVLQSEWLFTDIWLFQIINKGSSTLYYTVKLICLPRILKGADVPEVLRLNVPNVPDVADVPDVSRSQVVVCVVEADPDAYSVLNT